MRFLPKSRLAIICAISLICLATTALADDTSTDDDNDRVRKTTAVALNYCRAALHRIRRAPQKHVFHEEQTRILNNLDLNQIEDPEVIELYKSILDEISQVEISERERIVISEQFRRNVHRQLGTSFFVIGAQVATGQLGNAVQAGANSWWDYRNTEVRRDSDHWKVEKAEFTNLTSRSSRFLDSFWRLSQKNEIPDRWLIRDQDLDQLNVVLAETDASRRLRMLKRLERFMEYYPPYWYYVAKTEQQLGRHQDAISTYRHLSNLGSGHFRHDDMLASSMANMALLQETIGDPGATQTAMRVYDYSLRNWEANLVCAWVLGRHAMYGDAEELIFCNLDEDQETRQSHIALVSLYYHSSERTKLAGLLNDPAVTRSVPVPGLLLCAQLLGAEKLPQTAHTYLASTLSANVRHGAGGTTITVAAAPAWKIQDASPQVIVGGNDYRPTGFQSEQQRIRAQFVSEDLQRQDTGGQFQLALSYPGTPLIRVTMQTPTEAGNERWQTWQSGISDRVFSARGPGSRLNRTEPAYQIGRIELNKLRLTFGAETEKNGVPAGGSGREVRIEDTPVRS